MDDSFVVDMLYPQADLGEEIEDLIVAPVLKLAGFSAGHEGFVNLGSKITLMGIIHNNTQFLIISSIDLSKSYYIRILKHL